MKRTLNEITTDIMTQQMNMEMALNPEEFEIQLQSLFTELYHKEDGIYWFYKGNEKNIQLIDEHIEKCNQIKKTLKSGNERMKQLIISSHQETKSMPKYSVFNPLKIRKSNGAVDIIDENKIPQEYWKKVETIKLDKKRILEDLKEGIKIPGVRLTRKDFIGGLK